MRARPDSERVTGKAPHNRHTQKVGKKLSEPPRDTIPRAGSKCETLYPRKLPERRHKWTTEWNEPTAVGGSTPASSNLDTGNNTVPHRPDNGVDTMALALVKHS